MGQIGGWTRSGGSQGVEHVEFERGQQHVIPPEPLDDSPNRRRGRGLVIGEGSALAGHGVGLLQLRVGRVAGRVHYDHTLVAG